MSARTRRDVLGTLIASLATGALMGGCAITLATPEILEPVNDPVSDATKLAFLTMFRKLPSDQARKAFLHNLRRYVDGETTLEDAGRAFYIESGMDPDEAEETLAEVKARSPSPGWGEYARRRS